MYRDATLSEEEILKHFDTSLSEGLSSRQAEDRLATAGYNEVTARQVPWWEIALRQFKSAFIYLLLIAAAIVFVIGEYLDAGIILGFVIINAALGFYQEVQIRAVPSGTPAVYHPQMQGETGLALAYDQFPEPGAGRYHQTGDRRCSAGRCPYPQHA